MRARHEGLGCKKNLENHFLRISFLATPALGNLGKVEIFKGKKISWSVFYQNCTFTDKKSSFASGFCKFYEISLKTILWNGFY